MYPNSITKECTKTILDQMNRALYKIYYGKEENFTFGFFCHIKYENINIPTLITNGQTIYLEKNNNIKVKINKEIIYVDLGDVKYYNKEHDISIIEIKESKNNNIYFLQLDERLYENNYVMNLNNESIYIIHYDTNKNISDIYVTFGKIKDITYSKIIIWCNTNLNYKLIFNFQQNQKQNSI